MLTSVQAHAAVYQRRGKANTCVWGCKSTVYHWANLTGNYDDIDDYAPMCAICHRRYDLSVSSAEGVPLIRRTNKLPSDLVREYLTNGIVSGQWASGDTLPSVTELSNIFKVSRYTANKALQSLQSDGLIQIITNWGCFVA